MEIIDELFDDWEGIEELLKDDDAEENESESETSDEDSDDSEKNILRCGKCRKVYHVLGWLRKHEKSCDGTVTKSKRRKPLTPHQERVRQILASIGFDEYYEEKCMAAIASCLNEICQTDDEPRFASYKEQASLLVSQVQSGIFFKELSAKIWAICFGRDNLRSTSRRQQYVAQEMHALRNSAIVRGNWAGLMNSISSKSDVLLLQRIITAIFDDINLFRNQSIRESYECASTTSHTTGISLTSLIDTERDIVCYIGGYVCRKVRDRLQKYVASNVSSKNTKVQQRSKWLSLVVNFININMIVNCGAQAPSMSFPNLMTLSLSRGGLSQINSTTFTFFCYLELSIRPFLNLNYFRSSDSISDGKMLKQLVENSSLLKSAFPTPSSLPSDQIDYVLLSFIQLYYRVRKWAFLKVYKENKKCKEAKANLKKESSKSTTQLHGKDSIRKALLNNSKHNPESSD